MTASASLDALGTTATLVVTDPAALDDGLEILAAQLAAIDRACSRFRDDSELVRANARAGETVAVSPLFAHAVRAALDVCAWTHGAVSPALGRPLRLAGYDRTFRLVRERDRWAFAAPEPAPGAWRDIAVDVARREVTVPGGVELDLGATAKAFAADRAAAAVHRATGCGVLVSLGGDVAVAGGAPHGGWLVGIADDHAGDPDVVVAIAGGGLATSSTTTRRWTTDRGDAHHILDPRTSLPVDGAWRTVSVAAASCLVANAAATAAIVRSSAAADWLAGERLPARLVDRDGRVARVGGWPAEAVAA